MVDAHIINPIYPTGSQVPRGRVICLRIVYLTLRDPIRNPEPPTQNQGNCQVQGLMRTFDVTALPQEFTIHLGWSVRHGGRMDDGHLTQVRKTSGRGRGGAAVTGFSDRRTWMCSHWGPLLWGEHEVMAHSLMRLSIFICKMAIIFPLSTASICSFLQSKCLTDSMIRHYAGLWRWC